MLFLMPNQQWQSTEGKVYPKYLQYLNICFIHTLNTSLNVLTTGVIKKQETGQNSLLQEKL